MYHSSRFKDKNAFSGNKKFFFPYFSCTSCKHRPMCVFATLRLRWRPDRDGSQSALWDYFGGRIVNMAAFRPPLTVPQCTLTTLSTRSPPQPQCGQYGRYASALLKEFCYKGCQVSIYGLLRHVSKTYKV